MSKIHINRFPVIITDDIYYKLSSNTEVTKDNIQKTINKDVLDYINKHVNEYKEEFIEEITKDLRISFPKKYILDYLNTSYLVKLKSSDIDSKTIQKYDEEIDKKEKSEEIRELYKLFNKTIRKISKDRPNDFNKVISSIIDSVNAYKEDFIEDKEVNEAIEDLIEESEQKPDKLSKYVKETTKSLFKVTIDTMKITFIKAKQDFVDKNSDKIETKVKAFKEDFESKYKKEIVKSKADNIVNLKEYIYKNYLKNINFVECNNELILIFKTKLSSDDNSLFLFSDKISTEVIKVDKKDIDYIKRLGDTFTLVLRKEE